MISEQKLPSPYDEFWQAPGAPRAHQELLHGYLTSRKPGELEQLRRVVRRHIAEQEVTFNILGVPEGTNRPWQLDSVPFVVAHDAWLELGRGLRQRARLLNHLLDDIYGPQTVLEHAILPAELVLGHPEFWRACHGWQPVGRHRLHLYACDVGRTPSSEFVVYSDRTAAPTGAGYALENRLVMGRALADLFRDYSVLRVSRFFDRVRGSMERLAPSSGSQPRVVVLTAGAEDESSFEHAYLARYLGYELVEGRDLTVRHGTVYLKTLEGLQRVDVILRRVFDALCDPLELREDSLLGVPGLTGAARAGRVAIANALGSSVAEAPALRAYMPALCRFFLDEDLILKDVPVLWCGDPGSLRQVLGRLQDFVLKPAFRDRRGDPIVAASLSAAARAELERRLEARPAEYVAERWSSLSRLPLWVDGELLAGEVSLRTFLCRSGDDYEVMPGGLARMNAAPDGLFLSMRGNGVSKDVWIPSPDQSQSPLLPAMPDERVELRRGGVDLPSRLLDDIYWLGRYVERCDATSRLVRAGLERIGLETGEQAHPALDSILKALHESSSTPGTLTEPAQSADGSSVEALLLGALFDEQVAGSLRANLLAVHRLTLSVRSRLSRDAWHVLRKLTSALDELEPFGEGRLASAIDALDQVLILLAAVRGTIFDNMVRGHAWLFLEVGRHVERGIMALTFLEHMLPTGASRAHMEALLEVADSLLTYRARYLSSLQAAPVVDLVLTDQTNPRSLAFQVEVLQGHLRQLPRTQGPMRSKAERRMLALWAALSTADVEQACSGDGSGLRAIIEDSRVLLRQFSDDLSEEWFSHAGVSRALSPPAWVDEELEPR